MRFLFFVSIICCLHGALFSMQEKAEQVIPETKISSPLSLEDLSLCCFLNKEKITDQEKLVVRMLPDCLKKKYFSPEKMWLLSGCKRIKLLSTFIAEPSSNSSGRECPVVCFSPDGKQIAVGGDHHIIKIFNDVGICLKILEGTDPKYRGIFFRQEVKTLSFSSDGKWMVSAARDRSAKVWDLENDQCLITCQYSNYEIESACLSPDKKKLLVGTCNGIVGVNDVKSGEVLVSIAAHPSLLGVHKICFFQSGDRFITSSGDSMLKIWALKNEQYLKTLSGHKSGVSDMCLSPNETMLASAGGFDCSVRLWDLSDYSCTVLEGHTSLVDCVCFLPSGNFLFSGDSKGILRCWDTKTGSCVSTITVRDKNNKPLWLFSLSSSPEGDKLAYTARDDSARFLEFFVGLDSVFE